MIEQYTSKLQNKQDLSFDEISQVMEDILKGAVPDEKTATFLKCLREKGESDEELMGMLDKMQSHAVHTLCYYQ